MSEYINHATRELKALGYDLKHEGSDMWIARNVFQLLDVFSKQEHNTASAAHCIDLFGKLALFRPLSPLTGEDDEWVCVSEDAGEPMWQNKRFSPVFKEADGEAYDTNGRMFREPDGDCYYGAESGVPVTFPYTPTTVYVDVDGKL